MPHFWIVAYMNDTCLSKIVYTEYKQKVNRLIRGEPTWEPISILPMNRRSGPTPLIWRNSCGGGGELLRAGRESRLARVHHITVRGNEWYDHIARQGGHAVSFVQHYYGMSYQEAMELLLGNELGRHIPPQSQSGRSRLSPSPCLRPTPICAVCTPT